QSIDRAVDIGCRRVEAELGRGRDDLAVLSANGDFKFIKWVHGRSPRAPDEFFPIRWLANRDLDSVPLLHRLRPPGRAVVLDMTSLRGWHWRMALGRRAPFASGLWIIRVAAISRIPLSFFCSRHAIQLRSVHIRISADRPVGLFLAGKAPRAYARRDVVGCRLSRILRLRRPLSPRAADSWVDCLQFLRRSDAAPKPKSRPLGNRHRWRSVAARVFQICGVFSRDSQRGDRHRLAEAEYRSADRHLFFHIHSDRLSGRPLPWRAARLRAIPSCAFRLVFPSSHCWSDLPSQGDHAAVPPPRKFPLRYLQLRLRVDLVRARTRQENPIRGCRGAICHADF